MVILNLTAFPLVICYTGIKARKRFYEVLSSFISIIWKCLVWNSSRIRFSLTINCKYGLVLTRRKTRFRLSLNTSLTFRIIFIYITCQIVDRNIWKVWHIIIDIVTLKCSKNKTLQNIKLSIILNWNWPETNSKLVGI